MVNEEKAAEKCEEIAIELACKFHDWSRDFHNDKIRDNDSWWSMENPSKRLLQIYLKEKENGK